MFNNILIHKILKLIFLFSLSTIIISTPFHIYPQNSNITFEHFSIAQGLSIPIVYSVIQDKDGYLWFGTWGHVIKYDGYRFTAYTHLPNNPNSHNNTFTQTLYEDREGIIWVGNYDGLEKFDKRKDLFTHYKLDTTNLENQWSNHVFSICEDKYGILWVGTGDGLNKFDRNSGKFICMRNDNKDPESISSNSVTAILEDKAGSLWFGTGKGLDKLDRKTGKFIHVWFDPNNKSDWSDYTVKTLFEDKSGIIWLGTRKGIVAFDQKAGTFTPYINREHGLISSICEDESGRLWIGSYDTGLYSFDKKTKKIMHYLYDDKNPGSLSSNFVTSICFERSGTLWITTYEGVNKLNLSEKAFQHYPFDEITNIIKGRDNKIWINTRYGFNKLDSRTGQVTQSPYGFNKNNLLYEDNKGSLWFAKEDGGLVKQDKTGQTTKFYTSTGEEFRNSAYLIYEAHDGSIWIGGNGFFSLDSTTQTINNVNIPALALNYIYEDSYGLLWICTFNQGLYSYDRKNDSIKSYMYVPHDTTGIPGRTILDAYEDKNGILWFGTNGGLIKYDRSTDSFIRFTDKDGLHRFFTFTILEDNSGNFWFNDKGISKFNPATLSIKNYDVYDGLPENGFRDWPGVKSDDGRIYFANKAELIGFHPDSIQDNKFIPPIVITNFLKFEKSFPLQNEIQLPHNDNFISFEFAALNYVSTEKNQYAYKMEGVDKDWVYSGTRRFASYPNLEPGKYIFRVKGSNNDEIWNEEGTSITIIISPPFWKTWWAYTFYGFLFLFSLYGLRRYELNRLSFKNQVKTERAVLKEREETDKMKSRFFANISHEFRTPLTLILGPAEKIVSNTSDDHIKDANIIKRNSRRLLQLINQLLDLSRLEAGKLKLEASKGNIVSFVKGVALSFESLSESKDITLKLMPEKEFIELYFDKEKMMKILTNILSNAFKFTPEEGMVTVSVNTKPPLHPPFIKGGNEGGSVEIKIRDTGIGIDQEEIPKLFDRFYQMDSSHTREYEGTGIGLALTKELVDLHHGNIKVKSEKDSWTEFTLEFPLGREHLTEDEILEEKEITEEVILSDTIINGSGAKNLTLINDHDKKGFAGVDSSLKTPQNDFEANEDKTIILIVEDNYDMREYIKEALDSDYLIEEAVNGEQGVRKAEKIIPDLIVSDMMMPKMDGNELVRILKNDEKTSHIPIILLTAKAGHEDKLEGLETGADDYLTKPFDIKELQVRIKNLINIRKKLQEKFSRIGDRTSEIKENLPRLDGVKAGKLSSIDEKFMIRVGEVIEKHIAEEKFDIEEFCKEAAMSRTQLHRKLKALTGKSASHYIRFVKLTKAKKMIEEQAGNISEIAYSLGFSSPAYFTRCFKEEFGYPPSASGIKE